ncbi:MAG: prenyltransferase/squalene oxidase repeat-containing protein, partial [Planctomycetia bacterium]|nr:prenyltransferase/squalene oxidase repeat-containing protein [Planctomycetia bacterium]
MVVERWGVVAVVPRVAPGKVPIRMDVAHETEPGNTGDGAENAVDPRRLRGALRRVRGELLSMSECGMWRGRPGSSPLATAAAVSAFSVLFREQSDLFRGTGGGLDAMLELASVRRFISRGIAYLLRTQRPDGGWSDCEDGFSNIATTLQVRSAFALAGPPEGPLPRITPDPSDALARADQFIVDHGGFPALKKIYGQTRPFTLSILITAALAGRVAWSRVPDALSGRIRFPAWLTGLFRITVTNHELPLLVAHGLVHDRYRRSWNPLTRWLRRRSVRPALRRIRDWSANSGGAAD